MGIFLNGVPGGRVVNAFWGTLIPWRKKAGGRKESETVSQAATALNQQHLQFTIKNSHGLLRGTAEINGKRIQYNVYFNGKNRNLEINLIPYPGSCESLVLFNRRSALDNLKVTAHNIANNENFSTELTLNGQQNIFTAEIENLTPGKYEILFGEVQEKPTLAIA